MTSHFLNLLARSREEWEANTKKSFWGDGPIELAPTDEVAGVVVDAKTGRPLPGAVISAPGLSFERRTSMSPMPIVTDEDGRFVISKRRISRIAIACDGYQGGRLAPQESWRSDGLTDLKVSLRPLVEVRGRLIDQHTMSAPVVPLSLSYEYTDPAGEGWSLVVEKRRMAGQWGPEADFGGWSRWNFHAQVASGADAPALLATRGWDERKNRRLGAV